MKKTLLFFAFCMAIVGSLGGFGYALHIHEYVTAACIAVLSCFAFPTVKKVFKELAS